jgi:putative addiction module component (TIGR02574 family)
MATELNQMINEALELSEKDRATLAGLLLKSLEDQTAVDPDIEAAWSVEAERRWKEIQSGAITTIPWDEVKAKLQRR